MSRLPRRHIPLAVQLAVALRQLGFAKPQLDHDPALGLRERTPDGGYDPPEHSPDHLVWRDKDEHAVKTRGNGATTAGSDVGNMRHLRDLTASEIEFRRRLQTKKCGKPPSPDGEDQIARVPGREAQVQPTESRMSKRELRASIAAIKKHKDAIAKHRDALREIQDDLAAVLSSTGDGLESLEYAVDALSQYL